MKRLVLAFPLFVTAAAAGDVPLRDFFDPAAPMFRLPAVDEAEFAKLDAEARLRARGFAPGTYHEPPKYDDSLVQAMSPRVRLFPGFAYAARLSEKQRFWAVAAKGASLEEQLDLMERLPLPPPREFLGTYVHLAQGIDARRRPEQALLALRHSERQFRDWWVGQLGEVVRAAPRGKRRIAIRRLSGYLRHKEPDVRFAAARVLGALADDEAVRVVERGIEHFDEPELRGALVRARARQGGETLPSQLGGWLRSGVPDLSRAAVAALRADRAAWSLDLLQDAITNADARLFEDLEAAITARNGAEPEYGGPVDFYGMRTRSRRVVFCIDVSTSMDFPMDGYRGQREPRRRRTMRELSRTLERLPGNVEFNVILFSQRLNPLWRRLRPAEPENRAAALQFIRDARTEPGTDMWAAAGAALRSGADTAFFLSDGEPSVGTFLDPALILHEVAAHNRDRHLRIHAVGLSRDQNTELLFNLAKATGGQFHADR